MWIVTLSSSEKGIRMAGPSSLTTITAAASAVCTFMALSVNRQPPRSTMTMAFARACSFRKDPQPLAGAPSTTCTPTATFKAVGHSHRQALQARPRSVRCHTLVFEHDVMPPKWATRKGKLYFKTRRPWELRETTARSTLGNSSDSVSASVPTTASSNVPDVDDIFCSEQPHPARKVTTGRGSTWGNSGARYLQVS